MCWFACTELPGVAIEIIIEVSWVDDGRVDDCPCRTVPAAVGISIGGREEDNLVALSDDNERDGWSEA